MESFLHDPLNMALYDVYKGVKNAPFKIKLADEKVFNELYYLCVSIKFGNIGYHDIEEVVLADMGYQYAPSLIISMMYAVLIRQERVIKDTMPINHDSWFQNHGGWYFDTFYDFTKNHQALYQTDFSPKPESAETITRHHCNWERLTFHYNQHEIVRILSVWKSEKDKLLVLADIEKAFKQHHDADAGTKGVDGPLLLYPATEISDFQKIREKIINHKELTSPVANEPSGFASYVMIKDEVEKVMELLHQFIDGKNKPQAASLPVRAAIDAKKIHKPTYEVYQKEFPNCKNSRTSFEKYAGLSFDTKTAFSNR